MKANKTNVIESISKNNEFIIYHSDKELQKIAEENAGIPCDMNWNDAFQMIKLLAYMERSANKVDLIIFKKIRKDRLELNADDILNDLLDDSLHLIKDVIISHRFLLLVIRHYVQEKIDIYNEHLKFL